MPQRKIQNRHIRNVQKSHGVYYVTIPVGLMRSLKWQERQKVVVKKYGKGKVLISDWPIRRSS